MPTEPLPIGKVVEPWGKVIRHGYYGEERWYWFLLDKGGLAMVPAAKVEKQ